MKIDDTVITKKIVDSFYKKFVDSIDVDVVIVGAGPSGLVAARYLAKNNKNVVIFERKLSVGGGIWGGGMGYPVIVIQKNAIDIFKEVGVKVVDTGNDYYTADSIESVCKLCSSAIDVGVKIFNLISVEDVVLKNERIRGVVINHSAIELAKLHVDPISIGAKVVIDATGHGAEVCTIVQKKVGNLNTKLGRIEGEKSMCAELGEKFVVENTKQVYPGLYVTGMAVNAVFGGYRMGPIFGGMVLSGKKVAERVLAEWERV
ncbi:MAG: sulfide-dependent adenosine diphosphate thiazole synthase [Candidatus Thermoplasmatota archaeon]